MTWELGKALDPQLRLSMFILGQRGAIEGGGEGWLPSQYACGFGVAVRNTGTPRQKLLLNRAELMEVEGGPSLSRSVTSRGCLSGRKKVGEEAFLHQRGHCQKASRSARRCLLFSVIVYFVT